MKLVVRNVPIRVAMAAIGVMHRHLPPPIGAKIAFCVFDEIDMPRGWCTVGRPVSRVLQAKGWLEVTRVATDGCPNACSALYGATSRYALREKATGIITYTLETEPGTSLRASGWVSHGLTVARGWSCPSRIRSISEVEHLRKQRWAPPWSPSPVKL